jgi:hypothetical protein
MMGRAAKVLRVGNAAFAVQDEAKAAVRGRLRVLTPLCSEPLIGYFPKLCPLFTPADTVKKY